MKVRYIGTADAYELSAADFKKGGLDNAGKKRFPKDVAVEVDDEVGQLLTTDEEGGPVAFNGSSNIFEEVKEDDAEEAESGDGDEAPKGSAGESEMTESGRASQSAAPTTAGTTGAARGGRGRAGAGTSNA